VPPLMLNEYGAFPAVAITKILPSIRLQAEASDLLTTEIASADLPQSIEGTDVSGERSLYSHPNKPIITNKRTKRCRILTLFIYLLVCFSHSLKDKEEDRKVERRAKRNKCKSPKIENPPKSLTPGDNLVYSWL
jgi:hypothetical protein